jgi:multicomponent Na+:H+ antiporter subunit G
MDTVLDVVSGALLLLGATLTLVAAWGLHRLNDVYSRIHAATKPVTLGMLCSVSAAVLQASDAADVTKLILALLLLFTTAPVAASMLARAAHANRVPMGPDATLDELGDHLGD